MDGNERRVATCCGLGVFQITWNWVEHSPIGVALESAPSLCHGLADRAVCSGTVLPQPFK